MNRLSESTRSALAQRLRTPAESSAQGPLAEFRMSAATLVTRGRGAELEFLSVRRAASLRFFPGFWALPGGVLDAADGPARTDDFAPFLRCALRELFEESGVLGPGLAAAAAELDVDARRALRRGLDTYETDADSAEAVAATAQWAALVAAAGDAAPEGLTPFTWTTTPAFAQRRYRALYCHLELPAGEAPEILPGELDAGEFVTPAALLARWRAGELQLVPPLVYLAEALEASDGELEPALIACAERSSRVDAGALHAVTPVPGVQLAALPTPTLPPATTTNCYIVGLERPYVVDPATYEPEAREALVRHLRETAPEGISGVLVTHHHADHTGSVDELARVFDAPVLAHPETLARLRTAERDTAELHEGQRLELGRGPGEADDWWLEVLHTPGHAPGHLCFRESRLGALIAGDLASTVSTIQIDPPEGHLATYLAQLERVAALGISRLLPSHGPVAVDGQALIAKYLRHRSWRRVKLEAALRELEAADETALLLRVYDDTPAALHGLARGSLRAGLEQLAEEGLARQAGDGRWRAA